MDLKFNEFPNWEKHKDVCILLYESATRVILFKPLQVRDNGFIDVDKDNYKILIGSSPAGIYDNKFSVNANSVMVLHPKHFHDYFEIPQGNYKYRIYWDDCSYQANDGIAPASILDQGRFCELNWMKLKL